MPGAPAFPTSTQTATGLQTAATPATPGGSAARAPEGHIAPGRAVAADRAKSRRPPLNMGLAAPISFELDTAPAQAQEMDHATATEVSGTKSDFGDDSDTENAPPAQDDTQSAASLSCSHGTRR